MVQQITIIRGGRRPTVTQLDVSGESRLVALPPAHSRSTTTVTEVPPVLVLGGARNTRYVSAERERSQTAARRLLTVIRGTRPRLVRLERHTHPGPLILTIPD